MKQLIAKILISGIALKFTSGIIEGMYVDGWGSVFIAAIILGIVNAVIRPLLLILTLPLNVFTLGLFTFVINGLLLKTVATVVAGFDIVGVSLDNNKKAWVGAINKMELPWHHISDLKGWQCEGAAVYGINAIPATILFGPDGKVVAAGLRAHELAAKLAELL